MKMMLFMILIGIIYKIDNTITKYNRLYTRAGVQPIFFSSASYRQVKLTPSSSSRPKSAPVYSPLVVRLGRRRGRSG